MTDRLPRSARRILEEGVLCHVAVRTPDGPHLTPIVYVLDGGRLWVTTSRSSVKARVWRTDRAVSGLVRGGDVMVTFRGTVRTYDALDPLSWPAAAVAGPGIVRAAARFALKNARFFAGYAVDAGRVPLAWSPPGRVFTRIDLTSGIILSVSEQRPGERWGGWAPERATDFRSGYASLRRARSPDLRVPAPVRRAVGTSGPGTLALEANGGMTVLPVAWRRLGREGAFEAALPRQFLELAGGSTGASAALTVDRLSAWRAADMAGMLLQGRADLFSPPAAKRGAARLQDRLRSLQGDLPPSDGALVRLRPERIVWWLGWESGTVVAG